MARKQRQRSGGTSSNPLLHQAGLEATLRYSPEESALSALLRQSRTDYSRNVKNEQAASEGLIAATRAADKDVRSNYSTARSQFQDATGQARASLAGLSPAAEPFRAAAEKESAGATRRLAEAEASSRQDLVGRRQEAAQGRVFANRSHATRLREETAKVNQRRQELAGEKASFTLATLKDLEAAQAEAEQKDREYQLQVRRLEQDARLAEQRDATARRGQELRSGDAAAGRQLRRELDGGSGKGKRGLRSDQRYGHTRVTPAQAQSNKNRFMDLVANSKRVRGEDQQKLIAKSGYLGDVLKEYATSGRRVSRPTAQKVWRNYGFRLPVAKRAPIPKNVGGTVKGLAR